MYAEIGGADGANHKFKSSTEVGSSDGANHKIKLIEVGGADGVNHVVWRALGDFDVQLPSGYIGSNSYYDHGDYLYGEFNGHTTTNINNYSLRAHIQYVITNLTAGDIVKITWSANAPKDYSETYIIFPANVIYQSSSIDHLEQTITMPQNGSIAIGINLGSTEVIDRWFKIHSITINGLAVYP